MTTELEIFGIAKQTFTRTNAEEQESNKVCKHWNCKHKDVNFIITQKIARFTLMAASAGIENDILL